MRRIYRAITVRDIQETKVGTERMKALKASAKELQDDHLWDFLITEMEKVAHRRLMVESKDDESIVFPKAVLWTLDVMKKKVNNLAK